MRDPQNTGVHVAVTVLIVIVVVVIMVMGAAVFVSMVVGGCQLPFVVLFS